MRTNNSFPLACSLLEGEQAYALNGVRVGSVSRIGPEGGFGGLPTPLLVLGVQGANPSTLFLLRTKNKYPFLL